MPFQMPTSDPASRQGAYTPPPPKPTYSTGSGQKVTTRALDRGSQSSKPKPKPAPEPSYTPTAETQGLQRTLDRIAASNTPIETTAELYLQNASSLSVPRALSRGAPSYGSSEPVYSPTAATQGTPAQPKSLTDVINELFTPTSSRISQAQSDWMNSQRSFAESAMVPQTPSGQRTVSPSGVPATPSEAELNARRSAIRDQYLQASVQAGYSGGAGATRETQGDAYGTTRGGVKATTREVQLEQQRQQIKAHFNPIDVSAEMQARGEGYTFVSVFGNIYNKNWPSAFDAEGNLANPDLLPNTMSPTYRDAIGMTPDLWSTLYDTQYPYHILDFGGSPAGLLSESQLGAYAPSVAGPRYYGGPGSAGANFARGIGLTMWTI